MCLFFFSSRRRHTRWPRDWSSDVCSSDLKTGGRSYPAIVPSAVTEHAQHFFTVCDPNGYIQYLLWSAFRSARIPEYRNVGCRLSRMNIRRELNTGSTRLAPVGVFEQRWQLLIGQRPLFAYIEGGFDDYI